MNKYIYQDSFLIGPVTMDKPEWTGKTYLGLPYITGEAKWEWFKESKQEYAAHLASLPRYPVQGPHKWINGQEVGESEFRLDKWFVSGSYHNICVECKKEFPGADKLWFLCPEHSPVVAIPVKMSNYKKLLAETPKEVADMVSRHMDELEKENEVKGKDEKPVFGEWQLCPKCNGDGNLARYNSPSIVSTDAALQCDVCNGNKILARPILNT